MDYSTLVSAVNFSSVGTAILGVAAAVVTVLVAARGARMVLGFVKR